MSWIGIGLTGLVLAGVAAWIWLVPVLVVRAIQGQYGGRVTIASARLWPTVAVEGLVLHEGPAAGSPVWATIAKVVTDLTPGGLLRGRTSPGRVEVSRPRVAIRLDRNNTILTNIPVKGGGKPAAVPIVIVREARVTFAQVGRDAMTVDGIVARLAPDPDGKQLRLSAQAQDPTWGAWQAQGAFEPTFRGGRVELASQGAVESNPELEARLPFVPEATWAHVRTRGPVEVRLLVQLAADSASPVQVRTTVIGRGTTVVLPSLEGLTVAGTTGEVVIDGALVRLVGLKGKAIDGSVTTDGTIDLAAEPTRIDLAVGLDGVDIARTPEAWQLPKDEFQGRLTGHAQVHAMIAADGVDLSGSSGKAVIEGAQLGGIPVKAIDLSMQAEGSELKYDASGPQAAFRAATALALLAMQAPAPEPPKPAEPAASEPRKGFSLRLPKSITTHVELEDVELTQVLARAEALGVHLPFTVTGKLSLKAKASIPLGKLRDISAYAFHGEATLTEAHVGGVDLGRLEGTLDLDNGVLELSRLTGRLVSLPDGSLTKRPSPVEPVPEEGPLPPGGFRGSLRAELDPPGHLEAHLTGQDLPLEELAAPFLPRPTPVSGRVTLNAVAGAAVKDLADPKAWAASGRIQSEQITYQGATLDAVSGRFAIEKGRAEIPELNATLAGRPLVARVASNLTAPYDYQARMQVNGWELGGLLALVPALPKPAPVAGTLEAEAEAEGTLSPLRVDTRGEGHLDHFRAGPVPLGDVPFRWTTREDVVEVAVPDARPFDGHLVAEARVPTRGQAPIEASAQFEGIDLAGLSSALPVAPSRPEAAPPTLSGRADGRLELVARPGAATDPAGPPPVEANARLSAADLVVAGLPARGLAASAWVRQGSLHYEMRVETLGGKVKFDGDAPVFPTDPARGRLDGELQAVNVRLVELGRVLGWTGALTRLRGFGAVNANVRMPLDRFAPWVHGIAEVRDLSWGEALALGQLKGIVALSPTRWRIDPVEGELLGGVARGAVWSEAPPDGPRRIRFETTLDRASLARALAVLPGLAAHIEGYGSLRLAGRVERAVAAEGEMRIVRGRVWGLPLDDLRVPLNLTLGPGGSGELILRRFNGRVAGGQLRGDAQFGLGSRRAFRSELRMTSVALETFTRTFSDASRPGHGNISGVVTLSGADPALPRSYRGKLDLDLDDASLGELPVFRQIGRLIGLTNAQGALFEDGDLDADIGGGQVILNGLALDGPTVQLFASGTVGLPGGALDLAVLVNTGDVLPRTGQTLLTIIPGAQQGAGRALVPLANFLSDRLFKFHVTGTLRNPVVQADPTVIVGQAAVGFFAGVLRLPLGLLR